MLPLEVLTDLDRIETCRKTLLNAPRCRRLGRTTNTVCYLFTNKVYVVASDFVMVYDADDFQKPRPQPPFPDFVPYESMRTHQMRLVFTQSEINLNGAGCREDDEFHASGSRRELALVVVTRDGKATNRWADGTHGVTQDVRDALEAEEEYTQPGTNEIADTWLFADVYQDGTVKQLKGPRRNHPIV